jgi:transposase
MSTSSTEGCAPNPPGASAFPPQDGARKTLLETLHQPPQDGGRWTLARLIEHLPGIKTIAGASRRLKKWRIRRKRGRLHLTSPDPQYQEKLARIQAVLEEMRQDPGGVSVLYSDEFTFYRQPCLAQVWHEQGKGQPTAPYRGRANTKRRIVSTLDVLTGQVLSRTGSVIGVKELCRFLAQVRQHYGPERRLVLVWDNWPIHYHPELVAAAQQQRIELLCVPTYAPWTNPIEKFWNKLKETVLRMHRLSEQWELLRERVESFLAEHERPRPDLLRYVGLAT